jgi:hypothetical protein
VKRCALTPFPWLTVFFAMLAFLLGLIMLSPIPEKVRRKIGISGSKEKVKPVPPPKPEIIVIEKIVEKVVRVGPPYYTVKSGTDITKTSMGFDFKSLVEERPGRLVTTEREGNGSYEASFTIFINRPEAAKHLDEVTMANPELLKALPGLEPMIEKARVSPFFNKLYDNKLSRLKTYAKRIDRLLTKHNYYDCQTMLELEHPGSKRKVFLMQSDMDVVSDGSDGDRLPAMPDEIVNSSHYQPFTSFGWAKTGKVENPMIEGWKKLLVKEKASGNTKEVKRLETGINDLKKRSFLIAEYDPFIVIPVDVLADRESPFGPNVGDYAVVMYGKALYPAIVGDGGPTFKVGEASLRMAKELNDKVSPYSRPVSDVSVTYLVFPRSSGKWAAPNYENWRSECLKLVNEIGGLGEGYDLHRWADILPQPGQ